ncbi:DUF3578 domain-containing protein [Micromonospora sp. WMMC241]|uniref:MrcB family domain-containing protein n=1 Tax=Micromonospora sp. WMMC241 TaxID=3015159 RepID=UPI0022B66068|nr:DUF3578 domain-containing protein [Micromonospora sp. WMMC241]MCZ7434862.1 DUF3578 domain-containing protein [Micromonospora sp. WMMC241]
MRDLLKEILRFQPDWTWRNTPAMEQRGLLVRREAAAWLHEHLPELSGLVLPAIDDLKVEGRDGTGRKTEIPWVRVHSASRSPSATEGWYVVYLFSADGEVVYLSLNQGTTRWENGVFRPRPPHELQARVDWARHLLAGDFAATPKLAEKISLKARSSDLGSGYERGNVAAFPYPVDALPSEDVLEADLRFLVSVLGKLYVAADQALALPGEPAPEVADALTAVERAAGRRFGQRGFRQSAGERLAIERRAVKVACDYLIEHKYSVKDVGATQPYDIDARRGQERLFVEVKGTASDGAEVILTRGEVRLHAREHPNTMLVIVSGIALDRDSDPPVASGGVLRVVHPWKIDDSGLTPIAYRYAVPSETGLATPA